MVRALHSGGVTASYGDYEYVLGDVGSVAGVAAAGGPSISRAGSGYGHSGYGHSGGGHSGYGHKKKVECCELVVDPLTFASLLASIGGATAFLNVVITMANLPAAAPLKRRRRASPSSFMSRVGNTVMEGRQRLEAGPREWSPSS